MLNWRQNAAHRSQRTRRTMQLSMGTGLLLGMGIIGQQELFAWDELAATAHAQGIANLSLPGAMPVNSSADTKALTDAKKKLSDLMARQANLARRQAQREDISDVQAAWTMKREGRMGDAPKAISLRTHQFQNGLFTWEGVAEQLHDVSALLQALNRFPGWVQAPVLVQVQSELNVPSSVTSKGLVFQIQADLNGKQGAGS
jgi:hypothetical protein